MCIRDRACIASGPWVRCHRIRFVSVFARARARVCVFRNRKHEVCKFRRSQRVLTSWLRQNWHNDCYIFHGKPRKKRKKKKNVCELFITSTYSKSSWNGSRFEREMTTKHSVFGCARQGISPIFNAFTVRRIYVSCLFIDTDKQETKHTLR